MEKQNQLNKHISVDLS